MNKKNYKFITEYFHKGKKYGCEVFATSKEEAESQVESKKQTERIVGYDPEKVYES